MPPPLSTLRAHAHVLRRSRYAPRVLTLLLTEGPMTLDVLARRIRFRHDRLFALMHGEPPEYTSRTSLVKLQLVRVVRRSRGHVVMLTHQGCIVAKEITRGRVV